MDKKSQIRTTVKKLQKDSRLRAEVLLYFTLAVAAISIYSLQSAMISTFGDSEEFRIIMGNCVGAGVFVLISAISVFMIVKGTKAIWRTV